MNKKRISLLATAGLLSCVIVAGSSLAWLSRSAAINGPDGGKLPIESGTESGYFAYGNGKTKDTAYGIKTPRQLYNLAWLQYLGLLDLDSKQLYFELADNIDMTGWVLPPIGTETYPFISYFDGQGYAISNLTVSNNFSEYNTHPSVISAWDNSTTSKKKQPHILGLFGVVGNYNNLPDLPDEPQENVVYYDDIKNTFTNTALNNITIKSVVSDSLIGIAVGYNSADLKNIVVDNSTINVAAANSTYYAIPNSTTPYTKNISDHTLVGYTTKKKTISKASQTAYAVNTDSNIEFNATEDGTSSGWGGSIDMKSVTERLQTIRDNYSTSSTFAYKKTYANHANGTIDAPVSTNQTGSNVRLVVNDTNHKEWGHFNFAYDTSDLQSNYAQLGGGHLRTDNIYTYTNHSAFQITNGTQYLKITNGAIDKTTTQVDGTYWYLTSNNYLITNISNTFYYLNNNNGTLQATTSTNNLATWTIDNSNSFRAIYNLVGSTAYTITYSNNNFVLVASNATYTNYYIRYRGNNSYLSYNGTTIQDSTSPARNWSFSSLSGTTTISTTISGTTYYLSRSGNNLQLTTTSYNWTWGVNGDYLTLRDSNNYYIRGYNNNWVASNSNNNTTRRGISIDGTVNTNASSNITKSASNGNVAGPEETITSSPTKMDYSEDDVTYFPLTTVNNTNNFNPSENNTAYMTASYNIPTNASASSFTSAYTNIRFSKAYSISGNISNDFTASTGKFTNIYTVNDSMACESIINKTSDYERLTDAMTSLGNVLKTSNNSSGKTYGVHFMDAAISKDAITTAKYVSVNNVPHTNYELPVNAIDFNLKEFGYVNFIAGTYFNSTSEGRNNSFFSLYQIERLENTEEEPNRNNKINRILEIKNVYQHKDKIKTYSYVYELTDGTNTFYTKPYKVTNSEGGREFLDGSTYAKNTYVNTKPTDYTILKFNTARIKKNTISSSDFDKHVFFFEIPMNDGEFCLGSVSGGVGAYLMYLDIGANAAKTQRTIFYEKFELQESVYNYPLGVSLKSLSTSYASGVIAVDVNSTTDASDSACVVIKVAYSGTVKIDRNGNDVALTRSQAANAPPSYAGDSITLVHESGSTANILPTPISSTKYETTRMQYYDYMINSDTLVVTVFTDTKTTDMLANTSSTSRTIVQTKYGGHLVDSTKQVAQYTYDTAAGKDERSSMRIYRSDSGVKYTDAEMINTTSLPIPSGKLSSTVILNMTMVLDGVNGYTDTINLVAVVDSSAGTDMYYVFSQYTIVITPSSGTVTIKIVSTDTGKTIYIGTEKVTGNNQTITINASTNP